eukprot:Lankesteria_metandrocarpae@DN568_c0_g1_i1.p1
MASELNHVIDVLEKHATTDDDALRVGEALIVAAVQGDEQEMFVDKILQLPQGTQFHIQQIIQANVGDPEEWDDDDVSDLHSADQQGDKQRRGGRKPSVLSRLSTSDAFGFGDSSILKSRMFNDSPSTGPVIPPLRLNKDDSGSIKPLSATDSIDHFAESEVDGALRAQIRHLKNELQAAWTEKEEAVSQLQQVDAKFGAMEKQQKQILDQKKEELESMQAKLIEAVERLEKELQDMRKEKVAIDKEKRETDKEYQSELQRKQDELDVLNATVEKIPKLEYQLDRTQSKLAELSHLRDRNQMLEKQVEEYMQRVLSIEAANKNIVDLRNQIETYKFKNAQLESQALASKNLVAEKTKVIDTMTATAASERDLRKKQEAAVKSLQKLVESQKSSAVSSAPQGGFGLSDVKTREKLARLERENELLKSNKDINPEMSAHIAKLENDLDDTRRVKAELEKSLNQQTARLAVIDAGLPSGDASSADTAELHARLAKLEGVEQRCNELQDTLQAVYKSKDELAEKLMQEKEVVMNLRTTGGDSSTSDQKLLLEHERENVKLQGHVTTVEARAESLASELKQLHEKLALKDLDTKRQIEISQEKVLRNIRDQVQMREREMQYTHMTRLAQLTSLRKETALLASAFHQLGCNYIREKAEKEKVKSEYEAMVK